MQRQNQPKQQNDKDKPQTQAKFTNFETVEKEKPKTITERISSMKDCIMAEITAHNSNTTSQSSPSPLQIQKFATMLQSQFPNHRIDLIIKSLHTLFHSNCTQLSQIDDQSFQSCSGEISYTNADYMKANVLVREREAIRIPFQSRLTEEQRVAISYLNHGYGVRVLREYIRDPSINSTRYNNMITTLMKLAFRRLQDFVKNLGHSVIPLNSQDEKVIRAPLTNCDKWLPPDELETFYKFIKIACCLQSKLEISSPSAIKLYSSCIRQLRQRQANQQDYRSQKIIRGARRLPRITHNMYSNLANSIIGKTLYQHTYKSSYYPNTNRNNGMINQTNSNYTPNQNANPRLPVFGQQYSFNSPQISHNWRGIQKMPFV